MASPRSRFYDSPLGAGCLLGSAFGIDTSRVEWKEAGLHQGRQWAVIHSLWGPQWTPLGMLKLKWSIRVVHIGSNQSALMLSPLLVIGTPPPDGGNLGQNGFLHLRLSLKRPKLKAVCWQHSQKVSQQVLPRQSLVLHLHLFHSHEIFFLLENSTQSKVQYERNESL